MQSQISESGVHIGQYLTFTLQGQTYGMPIANVCEINRLTNISPVPQVPDFVSGVLNLRGKIIPVIDLNKRFGFAETKQSKHTCIIVVEGYSGPVGNIVDNVNGVIDLSNDQIQPVPNLGHNSKLPFLLGMARFDETVIILIDAVNVLNEVEIGDLSLHYDAMTN